MSIGTYFAQIGSAAKSLVAGMAVTIRYMVRPKEIVTIQYGSKKNAPKERYIPDRHRGIHFLETEKCIFCHICEKACPVDCIVMDGTRDGHFEGAWQGDGVVLSRFTLDLNKCIFCNLCCEPCPKECIHMGLEFDTAAYDRANGVKNLLTDHPWSPGDREREADALKKIAEVEAEAKRKKAEAAAKKKAEAAAAAAAAPKPAAPAAPGGAPAPQAAGPAPVPPAAGPAPAPTPQPPKAPPAPPAPPAS
jgi:NADH-quinone oxidoreductase subunit I/NAD(P)H-quinone oxidoreductase subunit I